MPDIAQGEPVTFEQEGMWLHDHLYDGQSMYLESWVCRLRGTVDIAAIDWTINQIMARHPALRSGITLYRGQLVQAVQPHRPTAIEWLRCAERSLDSELQRLVRRPLDLRTSPVRVTCLDLGVGDVVLVWQFHHLVVDDWALSILEREFQALYCARVAGRRAELPPLRMQPGTYAAAQRASGVSPDLVAYWRKRLEVAPGESTVPPDRPRPEEPSHQGGLVTFGIDADLGSSIRALARQSRATPFTVAAAAVAAFLRGCNGSQDQVLGTVVSRRGRVELDQMVTCLADLLPLCLLVRAEDSFAQLVKSTKLVVSETLAHRDIPFAALVRETGRSHKSVPCQVVLVLDDISKVKLDLPGVRAERLYVHSGICKFDLEITLVAEEDGYRGFLRYASDLFDAQTARRIQAGFCALLERAVDRPDLPLETILNTSSSDTRLAQLVNHIPQ